MPIRYSNSIARREGRMTENLSGEVLPESNRRGRREGGRRAGAGERKIDAARLWPAAHAVEAASRSSPPMSWNRFTRLLCACLKRSAWIFCCRRRATCFARRPAPWSMANACDFGPRDDRGCSGLDPVGNSPSMRAIRRTRSGSAAIGWPSALSRARPTAPTWKADAGPAISRTTATS